MHVEKVSNRRQWMQSCLKFTLIFTLFMIFYTMLKLFFTFAPPPP